MPERFESFGGVAHIGKAKLPEPCVLREPEGLRARYWTVIVPVMLYVGGGW